MCTYFSCNVLAIHHGPTPLCFAGTATHTYIHTRMGTHSVTHTATHIHTRMYTCTLHTHTQHMHSLTTNTWNGSVVFRPTNLERLSLKGDSVKSDTTGALLHRTKLQHTHRQTDRQTDRPTRTAGSTGLAKDRCLHTHSKGTVLVKALPMGLTSTKAKFLSMLICTANTGFPGAERRPASCILSLKKSIISSCREEQR